MLTETDADYAPWTVVEAHDRRFATLKIFATVIDALERGVAAASRKADDPPAPPSPAGPGDQCLQDERARSRGPVAVVNPRRVRYPAEEGPGEASRAGAPDLPAARARCHRVPRGGTRPARGAISAG